MPFKYGIEVETEKVLSRSYYDEDDVIYEKEVHLTPKDFAETHDKGVKMFVKANGEPLTDWMRVQRMVHDLTAVKRNSKAPAVKDFMGTELAVGDYVVTHYRKKEALQVCEVIGFVKQGKARILPVADFEQTHGILRFPHEMVQVPFTVLGEDPTGEWIPTEEEMH
jgi:hypothetical protein